MWVYPEVRTLGELLSYWSGRDPDRPALRWAGRTYSFAAFDRTTNRVAHWLLASGAQPHERVGFFGRNCADFYFAMFGTAKTRACFTPLNWRLSPTEVAELIDDAEIRLAIVEADSLPLWNQACERRDAPVNTLVVSADATLEAQVAAFSDAPPQGFISEEDSAIQLYTSGTTGKPKGVMLSHGGFNRIRLCEHLEPAYQWRQGDCFICALPNFHLLHIGIAVQCLYNGVAVALVRQFEPAEVLRALGRDRPSLLTLTPTMLQMLLDHPDAAAADFSSLRLTLYAGSPISLGLIKRAIEKMPCRFMQFYGATEANGAFSILRPDEHDLTDERRLQSCGRPLPLIDFKIVKSDGQETAVGEPGELVVRSPAITRGYWRQPETTAAAISAGWYRSGDVAWRDADGLYYIVDRVKDMIVSGGENIYSAEVENALSTHPAVGAVAVIGVPDERWGEAVKAVVVLGPQHTCTAEDLTAHCRERLAAYKIPKSIDFVDALPLVASGKVSKKDLRARYWTHEPRMIA